MNYYTPIGYLESEHNRVYPSFEASRILYPYAISIGPNSCNEFCYFYRTIQQEAPYNIDLEWCRKVISVFKSAPPFSLVKGLGIICENTYTNHFVNFKIMVTTKEFKTLEELEGTSTEADKRIIMI